MPLKSFRSTCSLSHILEGITKRCWKAIAMSTTKKTWGSQATVMAMICYKKRGCGSTNSSAEHVIRGNMRYACSEKLNQKKKQMNSPLSLMLSPLEFWTLSFWELNDLSSEKSFHPNKGGRYIRVFQQIYEVFFATTFSGLSHFQQKWSSWMKVWWTSDVRPRCHMMIPFIYHDLYHPVFTIHSEMAPHILVPD